MNGLMKYPVAESTGRATEGIDNIIASNRADYEASLPQPRPEATIGPTPWMETDEGQQTLMDVAMGSAFPGAAIGRVTKAAITGGQRLLPKSIEHFKKTFGRERSDKDIRNIIKDYFDQMMGKAKASKTMDEGMKYLDNVRSSKRYKDFSDFEWANKLNASRLRTQKVYDKFGLPHEPPFVSSPNYLLDQAKKLKSN